MKKRFFSLVCALIFILSVAVNANVTVDYNYSETVTPGTVRYVSQIRSSNVYYQDYWGRFSPWAHNECGTASVSMALSAIGINKTPLELGEYWISKGYTWGVPFSTVLNDVPGASGGETYDFFGSYKKYAEGDGSYSPVVIYFTRATNPNQTGNRHFVVVIGQNEDGTFNAANPSDNNILKLKIEKNTSGDLNLTVYGRKGTISGTVTEYDFRSAQYRNSALIGSAPEVAPTPEATPTPEVTPAPEATPVPEVAPAPEATPAPEVAPATATTPDLLFPASIDASAPTEISYDFCEIRFKDTGSDTYTVYFRRAVAPGENGEFGNDFVKVITATVGEGLIARNGDGTMSLFIPEGLEEGYLYRFFVSDSEGKSCASTAYALAKSL